jgi:hypothetical protein
MNGQREKTLSLVIVFFVLFSALIDPKISAGVAIFSLIGLAMQRHKQRTKIRTHHNIEGKTNGNDKF